MPPIEQIVANASSNSPAVASESEIVPPPDTFGGLISSISEYVSPTPIPTPEPSTTVIVNTNGARANIRSGPGLDFPIVAKGYPGDAFEVLSRSGDQAWWQICCITNADGATTTTADESWVAASVVRVAGDGEDVAISQQLLRPDLAGSWEVDWQCGSDRCEVKQCAAAVEASANDTSGQQLLTIDHEVVWDDSCFATDSWIFEVNQLNGRERTGQYEENFLYGYWLGSNPGEANGVYTLPDDQAVAVWCSGPHTVEIEEGAGWTTVYEGNTCHDVRTGVLVVLSYNKRWLFSGEFEGQSYDRAYFGDNETLRQRLTDTNLELSFVQRR